MLRLYYETTGHTFDMLTGNSYYILDARNDSANRCNGADQSLFNTVRAYNATDEMKGLRYAQDDLLDFSDPLKGAYNGTVTDYVQFTDNGTGTLV